VPERGRGPARAPSAPPASRTPASSSALSRAAPPRPLAPVRGVTWVAEKVAEQAELELYDENRILRELIELEAFARVEGTLVLATIARRWRLRVQDGEVPIATSALLRPSRPILAVAEPRFA